MPVVAAILPVFALILAGFGFARWRHLGDEAVALLNAYVVWLALPALLADFLAEADWHALRAPGFVIAFSGGMIATFLVSLALSPWVGGGPRRLARRSLDALSASYANTAYMGIPLAAGLFGPTGMAAAVIAALLTVCALFALSIVLVEVDLAGGGRLGATVGRVAGSVIRNPIVAAPIAGAAWAATGWPLPAPAAAFLKMLGASATPVALVTIGLFLAQPHRAGGGKSERRELTFALILKLAVQPALTALIVLALPLSPAWRAAAILLAALPTGTGPFMIAQLYGQEVALAARVTLVSTVLSAVTVSVLAWWLTG